MIMSLISGLDLTCIEDTMDDKLRKERYPVAEMIRMANVISIPIFACSEIFMGLTGILCQS
jgi:hypothetical protein